MKIGKRLSSILFFILFLSFGVLLILKPEICKKSVASSIILCSTVIIPSLFPFGVCALYFSKSGVFEKLNFLSPLTLKIFGLSAYPFFIFISSLIGGYPIGAKLLSEAIKDGYLTPKSAQKMMRFCVNAGPAFIISAVGIGILGNKLLGFMLFVSHLLSSFLICRFSGTIKIKPTKIGTLITPVDNFVLSSSQTATAVLNICSFVILFSVFTGYIEYFSSQIPILKNLIYFMEVTTAITKTDNIYLISFLLGFSNLCIWAQVLALGKNIGINILNFAFFRILHGTLSSILTFVLLKIFPVSTITISTTFSFATKPYVSSKTLSLSLLVLGIVFIISLSNRQKSGKILEELI